MTLLIQLHKNEGILLLPLTDTFKSPMLWIDTRALILLLMLKSVLRLLEIGIGLLEGRARWNANKTVHENHTLTQAYGEKFRKHETNYAAVYLAFFPFVLGCFGGIGSQAARFLCTLAFLELRQYEQCSP